MITEELSRLVARALEKAMDAGDLPRMEVPSPMIERPRDPGYGDFATNIALVTANRFNMRRETDRLAQVIADRAGDAAPGLIESATVLKGFINFRLGFDWLRHNLATVHREGRRYGCSDRGTGQHVQVEFVSANPTGPLTVGHARQGALGSAIAGLLEATGHRVTREFYINDYGNQVELLGKSVWVRYMQEMGREVAMPEDGYQGEYVREVARQIIAEEKKHFPADRENVLSLPEADGQAVCRERALDLFRGDQKQTLAVFGVTFDVWFSERTLHEQGQIEKALTILKQGGHLYEQDGAMWFRSTAFGDRRDRVLVRSDGRPTYLAGDIAYHLEKFSRGFDRVINVWGADHHGDVAGLRGALVALGYPGERLEVVLHQMVNLYRGGEMVRMSKRTGELVTLRELLDEVGQDAVRFFLLLRTADKTMDFDLDLAKQESSDNPVFYVQYAHARICSILAKAREGGLDPENPVNLDLKLLSKPEERQLLFRLAQYPVEVDLAAREREPARLVRFALDLAGDFHSYYNLGNRCRQDRLYVPEDRPLSEARLWLAQGVRTVLRNLLERILGIGAPERMAKLEADDGPTG